MQYQINCKTNATNNPESKKDRKTYGALIDNFEKVFFSSSDVCIA